MKSRGVSLILGTLALGIVAGDGPCLGAEVAAPRAIAQVVEFINNEIRQGWEDNEVQPSERADDAEWLRRVYLDIVGHIPPADKLEEFLDSKDPEKRTQVIDGLLEDPDYVRNFTENWTNILIGRRTPRRTSRSGMQKFLRESFARNRPWNEVVFDMVTAEGHFEENGAVNFLLAALEPNSNPRNDEYHVEATARVSRIFLGLQVQCTQCHNHPFNEWKQDQFWAFNSFLRQSQREDYQRYDERSGRMVDDYSELVYRRFDGPVYYEMRNGVMQVAYPTYLGTEIERKAPNRREELAKLMCHNDSDFTLSRAMANRMWGYFMGYGFTRPVDDMGPHNPPSHPAILDRLSEEFVQSGYDIKRLIRIICHTEPYHLTSRFNKNNQFDDPSAGEVPLFSHMYVKTMQAEQLYDSLIVATSADRSGAGEAQRRRWLGEFLTTFGGNEDDEPTLFSGSIPQALLMMNGALVQEAISGKEGSYLHSILNNPRYKNDAARVEALYLATLGRSPKRNELTQLGRLMSMSGDPQSAFQDLYWALLNSNEFIVNH